MRILSTDLCHETHELSVCSHDTSQNNEGLVKHCRHSDVSYKEKIFLREHVAALSFVTIRPTFKGQRVMA